MNTVEKAKDLIIKFYNNDIAANIGSSTALSDAKENANICIDEIVKEINDFEIEELTLKYANDFWIQVKENIKMYIPEDLECPF